MTPAFFETEIAISPRGGSADDDVIQQLDLQNSAGFENSPGKAHIRFGGGRLARYAACGITGVMPYLVLCRTESGVSSDDAFSDAA
jgi:hypothetical protein